MSGDGLVLTTIVAFLSVPQREWEDPNRGRRPL